MKCKNKIIFQWNIKALKVYVSTRQCNEFSFKAERYYICELAETSNSWQQLIRKKQFKMANENREVHIDVQN